MLCSPPPGSAKPIFLTVSKSIVLRGMGECDYRQEQEPFQGRLLQLRVFGFGLLQDRDVGVGVFPEGEKSSEAPLRYCGSPTFRTNSANRGSERMGSNKKLVFKPTSPQSRS